MTGAGGTVTDRAGPACADDSRNARLLALLANRIDAALTPRFTHETSYACACGHVFTNGEVIYRRKQGIDLYEWPALAAYCEACVKTWHPSWIEHAHLRPPSLPPDADARGTWSRA